jgi:hypothetical protein
MFENIFDLLFYKFFVNNEIFKIKYEVKSNYYKNWNKNLKRDKTCLPKRMKKCCR